MAGRPSLYSEELIDNLCEQISTTSKGLVEICKADEFPHHATVLRWLTEKDKDVFRDKYARARELQAELLADEIISIADDDSKDSLTVSTKNGAYLVEDREWTSRAKLRVDARKWKASKLAPKKYGDKLDVTSGGDKVKGFVIELSNEADKETD